MIFLNAAAGHIMSFLAGNSLYAALMLVFIIPAALLLKGKSPKWRILVWALVLVRLALPPDFSSVLSARTIVDSVFSMYSDSPLNGILFSSDTGELPLSPEPGISAEPLFQQPDHTSPWFFVIFSVWFTGAAVLLVRFIGKKKDIQSLLRSARVITQNHTDSMLAQWRRTFSIRRPVRIVTGSGPEPPFTSGIFKPVIYIPRSMLSTANASLLESVIAHECAHIKRLDSLWIQVQAVFQIAYFFHPAVWAAASRINLARECLCDRMVVSYNTISIQSYGSGLLAVQKYNLSGHSPIPGMPSFGNEKKKLASRIKNLTLKNAAGTAGHSFLGYAILLAGLFMLPMAAAVETGGEITPLASPGTTPEHQTEDKSFRAVFPVKGASILSGYGMRRDPFTGAEKFHRGVDIPAAKGSEVLAAAQGYVIETGRNRYDGNYVQLSHQENISTRYSHLDTVFVTAGQSIGQGQAIGTIGETGLATGPHLHFEVIINSRRVDPEEYLIL